MVGFVAFEVVPHGAVGGLLVLGLSLGRSSGLEERLVPFLCVPFIQCSLLLLELICQCGDFLLCFTLFSCLPQLVSAGLYPLLDGGFTFVCRGMITLLLAFGAASGKGGSAEYLIPCGLEDGDVDGDGDGDDG